MKLVHLAAIAIVAIAFGRSSAQQPDPRYAAMQSNFAGAQSNLPAQQELVVKTVPLRHMGSAEAVELLAPYTRSPGAGVFKAPNGNVTIRETQKNLTEILAVLAQYDRDPANVTLNFQLIAAENTNTRDPNLVGLDSLLRGVLKYSGYRLLTTSVAVGSERSSVEQNLSVDGEPFTLTVGISEVSPSSNTSDAGVHIRVSLFRDAVPVRGSAPARGMTQVLTTGVTVPFGQTVVLGTTSVDGAPRALILTVRPQLAATKK